MLSPLRQANLYLNLFGFTKVPLIWLCRPRIIAIDDQHVEVVIPLKRRTKNHLNSMYFGALAVGADVAGGFLAMSKAKEQGEKISLAFKGVKADFFKRPEGDVHFVCHDGALIDDMVSQTLQTGERINQDVKIVALCPDLHGDEPMAEFSLTLSIKKAA
jgi:acyl-coenzyme A thioesterase PaaI-like protein